MIMPSEDNDHDGRDCEYRYTIISDNNCNVLQTVWQCVQNSRVFFYIFFSFIQEQKNLNQYSLSTNTLQYNT